MKVCKICGIEKEETEFNKHGGEKRLSYCKVCRNSQSRIKYKENPESKKEYFRREDVKINRKED